MNNIYRRKHTVTAHQWMRHGDHPLDYVNPMNIEVMGETITYSAEERRQAGFEGEHVRHMTTNAPDAICCVCENPLGDHGILAGTHEVVCPGAWVVKDNDSGTETVMSDKHFRYHFEPEPQA